jgi:hypothetical protein
MIISKTPSHRVPLGVNRESALLLMISASVHVLVSALGCTAVKYRTPALADEFDRNFRSERRLPLRDNGSEFLGLSLQG